MSTQPEIGPVTTAIRPILLVEDNPMDIDFSLQAFEENKIANPVVICRDGEEALEFIHAHTNPDDLRLPIVVLLDLKLPKFDGLEVLRRIRADPRTHLQPIVILTSSKEEHDIVSGYDLGANSYIRKPVDFDQFMEAIRQLGLYWLVLRIAAKAKRTRIT